jgi:hypothetical protein
MGERKPKMAESIRKIRHVFMHEWDPIGVGEDPNCPEDEYDSYVMPMYSLLRQQKGASAGVCLSCAGIRAHNGFALTTGEIHGGHSEVSPDRCESG